MSFQRLHRVTARLVRIAFVAAFATLLATAAPVAAGDKPINGGPVPMGCAGGCH